MRSENFNEDVGLNIIGFKDDKYVIELEVEKRHHNTGGIVHGGRNWTTPVTSTGIMI